MKNVACRSSQRLRRFQIKNRQSAIDRNVSANQRQRGGRRAYLLFLALAAGELRRRARFVKRTSSGASRRCLALAGANSDAGSRRVQFVAPLEGETDRRCDPQRDLWRRYYLADESGTDARARHRDSDFSATDWLVLAVADLIGWNNHLQPRTAYAPEPTGETLDLKLEPRDFLDGTFTQT